MEEIRMNRAAETLAYDWSEQLNVVNTVFRSITDNYLNAPESPSLSLKHFEELEMLLRVSFDRLTSLEKQIDESLTKVVYTANVRRA
jgi:hypothetical protein